MEKHFEITRRRLQAFTSDSNLASKIYPQCAPVGLTVYPAPDRISYAEAMRGKYHPAKIGERFGPMWSTHWFKVAITIPREWRGAEVHFLWDSVSEACVWENGQPTQGLTGSGAASWISKAKPLRPQYRLTKAARGGERLSLAVEMACNHLFGGEDHPHAFGILRQAEIAIFDREAWALLWDFTVIADLAQHLPADTPRAGQALAAANEMVNVCDLADRKTWSAARAIAARFFTARNGGGQHNVSAIGHAHIDTAWLWPLAETRRKCIRTFATAIRYMADYPEYKFAASQAQQYAWMKESQPALYAKIKQRARQGRFIPTGGTWVEPDCNIPSGESLVRQFLFGQRFFQKEFGAPCAEFWNPDVFGYNGQLPQIMRGAGIRSFLTQKLSWNQFNKPASHTFLWEGIDGSQVLTHFPPADTYNGAATVRELLFNVTNFKDHERARESYYLFGYGDGGGGPSLEMLEQLRRMRDLDGLPRVQQRSPQEFFTRCAADARDLTVQVGELYFELHRGTYTTQARNKQFNRRAEELLHDTEFLAAVATATNRRYRYPATELARLWQLVLLNQFHDIIPGSSIGAVYKDSAAHYEDVLASGTALRTQAVAATAGAATATGPRLLAVNTLGCPRREVMELPLQAKSSQFSADGQPLGVVTAPPLGFAVATPATSVTEPVTVRTAPNRVTLENSLVRAVFATDGHLVSLFDKRAGREAIAANARANHFVLFDDEPVNFDAWDVDVFHLEKRFEVAGAAPVRVLERGPLRATIAADYTLSPTSRLKQTVSLRAGSARLEFACVADWQERHKFLKVEFPTTIRADQATYEIQFGHLPRPTHFNTSYDLARFEVNAQRWADLGEPGFGLALLNDCKYGYATHRNIMRLSLLRAPTSPDPEADQGRHTFRYALLPHPGSFRDAGVIEEAQRFNVPLLLQPTAAAPAEISFFTVERQVANLPHKDRTAAPSETGSFTRTPSAVILDTVKKAEDSAALIVRLYEAHGSHARVRLRSRLPVKSATRCNLLEQADQRVNWTGDGVDLEFTPFQIVTLKLKL